MKRVLAIFLSIFVAFSLLGCSKTQKVGEKDGEVSSAAASIKGETPEKETSSIPDVHAFTGEILAVEKGMVLVSPDEQNSAISPQVYVNVSQFSDYDFNIGDKIKVTFNGQVAQSFPPQILGVINIEFQ